MKLDEKRKPQDGRFSAKIDGRKIDFRVSTFPAYFGEKVVMRILDQEKGVKSLDQNDDFPKIFKNDQSCNGKTFWIDSYFWSYRIWKDKHAVFNVE